FPNAPGDVANLTAALAGNQTINLNVPITVGTLTIGSSTSAGAFAVAATGGSLTFQDPSGVATLAETQHGRDAANPPIALNSAWTVNNTSPAALAVGGSIAIGSHPITIASGMLVLNGNASGAGAVTVATGATLAGTGTIAPAADLLIATSFF